MTRTTAGEINRETTVRLNDKTVTLRCGQQQWRVSYGLLHRVVDSSAFSGEALELEVLDSQDEPQAT